MVGRRDCNSFGVDGRFYIRNVDNRKKKMGSDCIRHPGRVIIDETMEYLGSLYIWSVVNCFGDLKFI